MRALGEMRAPMKLRNNDDCTIATMATMTTMATKAQALHPREMKKATDLYFPKGDVIIVFTNVQSSTALWESCPTEMKTATNIHDTIMWQCYTNHH